MQREEIVGIQYLRAIAAIAVVAAHTAGAASFPKYFGPDSSWDALALGTRGVDLFFLISGFIITVIALDGPEARPAMGIRDFAARRFARIVPLMWLAVLSYLALQSGFRPEPRSLPPYLNALFLLPGEILPLHIWTLRQELLFYGIFAIAFLTRPWARLLLPLWLIGATLFVLLHGWTGFGPASSLVGIIGNYRNLGFGIGVVIGLVWLKRGGQAGAPAWRLPIDPLLVLLAAFILALAVKSVATPHLRFGRGSLLSEQALLELLLTPIVLLAIYVRCPPGILRRLGDLLGRASYAIYLFHPHAISGSLGVLARLAPDLPRWAVIAIVVTVATAFGVVIHLLVERPLVRCARRTLTRDPRPTMLVERAGLGSEGAKG